MKAAFFRTIQVLLLLSALGKLFGVFKWDYSSAPGGGLYDPLFSFVTLKQMLVSVALIELAAVFFIQQSKSNLARACCVLWLSLLFALYRLALSHLGFHGYCPCFGYWSSWANLSASQVAVLAWAILILMFSGSTLVIFFEQLRKGDVVVQSSSAKPSCNSTAGG